MLIHQTGNGLDIQRTNQIMRDTQLHSISLYITTLCNLKCAGCCAGTQFKNNITVEEVKQFREQLGHVKELVITGGEPTLHKYFADIMEEVFKADYERLILATNAYGLMKHIDLMDKFDEIRISHYDGKSYRDAQENTDLISEFKKNYKGDTRIVVQHITMIPDNDREGICGRAFNGIASYFKGKIYGCCVAAGMDTAKGMEFNNKWRESAKEVELPCGDCVFAT